jgi:hypothetical protein
MISANIQKIKEQIGQNVKLVAVSKTKPIELLMEAYNAGQRVFGENKVQEMVTKYEQMPKDIEWHMIGHLQSNKVKYIAPFVSLIHGVDSLKLLEVINKEVEKCNRKINCLLQVFIADEETKFGLDENELNEIMQQVIEHPEKFAHVNIVGLMGMASNTNNQNKISNEFKRLKKIFDSFNIQHLPFTILSMGMSGDYQIAVKEGSNMIRVGSLIFGER